MFKLISFIAQQVILAGIDHGKVIAFIGSTKTGLTTIDITGVTDGYPFTITIEPF